MAHRLIILQMWTEEHVFVLFCVATLLIGKDACLATVSTHEFILVDYIIVQSTVRAFVFSRFSFVVLCSQE